MQRRHPRPPVGVLETVKRLNHLYPVRPLSVFTALRANQGPVSQPTRKRKRKEADNNSSDAEATDAERSAASEPEQDTDDEGPAPQEEPQEEEESESSEEEEEEEYKAPRTSQAKSASGPRPRGRPKGTSDPNKTTRKRAGPAKPRATKARVRIEAGQATGELAIAKDNALFSECDL